MTQTTNYLIAVDGVTFTYIYIKYLIHENKESHSIQCTFRYMRNFYRNVYDFIIFCQLSSLLIKWIEFKLETLHIIIHHTHLQLQVIYKFVFEFYSDEWRTHIPFGEKTNQTTDAIQQHIIEREKEMIKFNYGCFANLCNFKRKFVRKRKLETSGCLDQRHH